jgi:hypothetical protein
MTITLKQYWLALQKSLEDFNTAHTDEEPKDEADHQSYVKQSRFLVQLAELGINFENASILSKAVLAHELKAFPERELGPERIITAFGGPLSLQFAEQVYLVHLKRFNEVRITDQNIFIRSLVNLEDEKAEVQRLACTLEAAIFNYKQKSSPLLVANVFASSSLRAMLREKGKHEALGRDAECRI